MVRITFNDKIHQAIDNTIAALRDKGVDIEDLVYDFRTGCPDAGRMVFTVGMNHGIDIPKMYSE